jgi:anti-sigma regulatory factor (Ser/Thr protein kinase)
MEPTIRIAVDDTSQIAEARRVGRKSAEGLGFDEVNAEHVAIIVTEVGTNLLKHAGRGEILFNRVSVETGHHDSGVEILALDRGDGIANLEKCMADGYSTGSSPGQGLGAIFRLSTYADIYSAPGNVAGKGTAVLARCMASSNHSSPQIEPHSGTAQLSFGGINLAKAGQEVCGDSWGSVQDDEYTTILVADGLGHGHEAAVASQEAVRVLRENPGAEPRAVLELAHLAMRSSRGAAVAVTRIDRAKGILAFAGVGNISAQIYSGSHAQQHLVSVNGIAGHNVQQLKEFRYPWPDNGILVLHSDGLVSATGLEAHPGITLRDPSLIAGVLYRDYCRGNDDATVVIAKIV